MRIRGTGTIHKDGYIEIKRNGKSRLEHRIIAEKALGKALPEKARIHHIDGNGLNNLNNNLVICPDDKYHQLLHKRQEALNATGNPNYKKCQYCKEWDAPENIKIGKRVIFHQKCKNKYEQIRTAS
jgi:hypothetical protein